MAKKVPAGTIKVSVRNVDDEAYVYVDGRRKATIPYGQAGGTEFELRRGEDVEVAFEISNKGGGAWSGQFQLWGPGGEIGTFGWTDNNPVQGPSGSTWRDSVVLTGV